MNEGDDDLTGVAVYAGISCDGVVTVRKVAINACIFGRNN